MSKAARYNHFKTVRNTGFGAKPSSQGARLTKPDGSPNVRKRGGTPLHRLSIYHALLRMSTGRFLLTVFLFYSALNLTFAGLYFLIGTRHLAGTEHAVSLMDRFWEAFFFSSQTLTTLGYGRVAPVGFLANSIAFFEALIGILSFALVTGLIYGRFARPKAFLVFSGHALIAPYEDGGRALMFRVAAYKDNLITDARAEVTAVLVTPSDDGPPQTEFFQLPLEIDRISSLALSWTIVHPLNDASPLADLSEERLRRAHLEILVSVRGYDDHFSATVQQRTSYTASELVWGARFKPMFHRSADGMYTVLELNAIDDFDRVNLPQSAGLAGVSS